MPCCIRRFACSGEPKGPSESLGQFESAAMYWDLLSDVKRLRGPCKNVWLHELLQGRLLASPCAGWAREEFEWCCQNMHLC